MRSLVLVAFACLLASCVSAQAIGTTQSQARALEDRWPNCSQVIHGRLGALHPEGDADSKFTMKRTVFVRLNATSGIPFAWDTRDFQTATLTYSPCVPPYVIIESENFTVTYDTFADNGDGKIVHFKMPEASGEVARFTGTYTAPNSTVNRTYQKAFITTSLQVVTQCSQSEEETTIANLTLVVDQPATITLTSREACPRFPYTNKAMPPGGVAALVIVLLCFVIQFGICAWYHKTYTHSTPYTTAGDQYQNVE